MLPNYHSYFHKVPPYSASLPQFSSLCAKPPTSQGLIQITHSYLTQHSNWDFFFFAFKKVMLFFFTQYPNNLEALTTFSSQWEAEPQHATREL